MSKKNPYTVPGKNGRISHKRFPKKATAGDIKAAKAAAVKAPAKA